VVLFSGTFEILKHLCCPEMLYLGQQKTLCARITALVHKSLQHHLFVDQSLNPTGKINWDLY